MTRIGRGLVAAVMLAAVVAIPPAHAGEPPRTHLRVASYNIHAGAGEDAVFDLDRTAAAIEETGAEIVGLQEVDVHWSERSQWRDTARELARRLDMYVRFAPIYSLDPPQPGSPRPEFGVAVLSAYPIVSFTNHEITRLSTQDPNPVPEPAPGFGEAVVAVRGALVHAYVTHLDYRPDPSVRATQVKETLQIMADDGDSAAQVLLGDFNATASAEEIQPLWTRLVDTYGSVGEPPGFTYPAGTPTSRIDYVATSRSVGVRDARVPDTELGVTASDHRAVVADLTVRRST